MALNAIIRAGVRRVGAALAISISLLRSPTLQIASETLSAALALGESGAINKTAVVKSTGPADALIDEPFLIDIPGSMGGYLFDPMV